MEGRLFTFLGSIGGHGQDWILLSHLVLTIGIVFLIARAATKRLQLVPSGSQNVMEAYISGVIAMGADTMGEANARRFLPLIGTLGLVIFVANMTGIFPGFESATANINLTLSLAIIVFIYYNYVGIKENGFVNYFKHFMGPMPILAPLMFPIELISHFSRIVSLSFRLFGSIRGDEMFLMVLLMLVPWFIPLAGFFMLTAFGVLQAFIFMILTYVYIAGSVMMAEEDH
ncbi:F0F1 ATP synthase subunit A [Poseidonibacter lekithochrous]|uniref:F0F1 ATP synthase subunit A n=1 Tax=Poseidonibacter TaxID=2321187 RepID=UPI001C0A1AF8|nr:MULTISPECIES: F0F1 ATP synthase subunit A [Poseidonibacter]MBU3014610.1 F0F1 ATP synthase subunit A [Poseidonibacter lekithochrous]MDO6827908.1 F0F1 ATP synthase subunit A [Poseidonibacter sp. 1_MG-2023]